MNAYNCTIPAQLIRHNGHAARAYIAYSLLQAVDLHMSLLLDLDQHRAQDRYTFQVRGPHATLSKVTLTIATDQDTDLGTLDVRIEALI